jgi:hypothetical protein
VPVSLAQPSRLASRTQTALYAVEHKLVEPPAT